MSEQSIKNLALRCDRLTGAPHDAVSSLLLSRGRRFVRRVVGRARRTLMARRCPSTSYPSDEVIRQFKEGAWQGRQAAEQYHASVSVASRGTRFEEEMGLRLARGRVLDVGAGTGRFSRRLASAGHRVIALDRSMAMLSIGCRAATVPYVSVQGSAFSLPFGNDQFDTVLGFWLLVHFSEWRRILAEMIRVVRPGGVAIFEVQNAENVRCARKIAPNAAFNEHLRSAYGYHSFAAIDEVEEATAEADAQPVLIRWYDMFNDNFVAQASLSQRYSAWKTELAQALRDEECEAYWDQFEASLPSGYATVLGRKVLFMVQKNGSKPPLLDMGTDSRARRKVNVITNDAICISRELFLEAFMPVIPGLADMIRGQAARIP